MLEGFVRQPKHGRSLRYRYISHDVSRIHWDTEVERSHWVLMTKDVIPGSRNKTREEQKALVKRVPNYQFPSALEAAVVIFMHTYKTGSFIYTGYGNGPETYTSCLEKVSVKYRGLETVTVGGLSAEGLSIGEGIENDGCGVAGFRTFDHARSRSKNKVEPMF